MSNHSESNEQDIEALRQEMLELYFGCHPNPEALQRRIDADPQLQQLHAEATNMADVLGEAALDAPPVELDFPEELSEQPLEELSHAASSRRRHWLLRHPLAAAAAALILVNLVLCSWWGIASWRHRSVMQDNVRLIVSAPSAVPDGAPMQFRVVTKDLLGAAKETDIAWKVLDHDGSQLAGGEQSCRGEASVSVAALRRTTQVQQPRRIEVIATCTDTGTEQKAELKVHPSAAAPLTHLTTDKPIYRPGEPLLFRATLLDRLTLRPRARNQLNYRIVDPKGTAVKRLYGQFQNGTTQSGWLIPPQAKGGLYAIEAFFGRQSTVLARQPFLVRRYQAPKLRKEIILDRETYMAGSAGSAEVRVSRRSGDKIPNGAKVDATLVVDGKQVWTGTGKVDAYGKSVFAFVVPTDIDRGSARFVARITDGGLVESQLRAFVVPTKKLQVEFSPEGGHLVANAKGRVYVQVADALDRPISATGYVADANGHRVATFETLHQGRGVVDFAPKTDGQYQLHLVEPFEKSFALPRAKADGVALRVPIQQNGATHLAMQVHTPGQGPWIAAVFCRGVLVGQQTFHKQGAQELKVSLLENASGVLRVTVFDRTLAPMAERLVQRRNDRRVQVAIEPKNKTLTPGGKQELRIKTTDEQGKPIAAFVGLCVSDASVWDRWNKPRIGLADQAQLFGDIARPERSQEFLGRYFARLKKHDHASRNTDLLLGSLAWRRFAWKKSKEEIASLAKDRGDFAKALPALEGRLFGVQVSDQRSKPKGLAELGGNRRSARKFAIAGLGLSALLFSAFGAAWILWWLTSRISAPVHRHPVSFVTGSAVVLAVGYVVTIWQGFSGEAKFAADSAMPAARANPGFERGFVDQIGVESRGLGTRVVDSMNVGVSAETGVIYRGPADRVPRTGTAPGWLFDDGLDGDIMANSPHMFDSTLGRGSPLARFFYDDGDGDLRARTENFFRGSVGDTRNNGLTQDTRFIPPRIRDIPTEDADDARPRTYRFSRGGWRGRAMPYAYKYKQGSSVRRQFVETLYWGTRLHTDSNGEATVSFDVGDSITTFVAHADAFGKTRVGQGEASFQVTRPFYMAMKLPTEVRAGDQLRLPVLFSCSDKTQAQAMLQVATRGVGCNLAGTNIPVPLAQGSGRHVLALNVTATAPPRAFVGLIGQVQQSTDKLQQVMRVAPQGFPKHVTVSDLVAGKKSFDVQVPKQVLPGATATLRLYPSPLASMQGGLNGILREPHGCFEQASSANYPNVMALNLMQATGDNIPAVAARARSLLPRGYQLTTSYECSSKGFEWFGKDPGHLALSAYGLLQYRAMAKVYDGVDPQMVQRTEAWLLSKRDGKGGFALGNDGHSFGRAPKDVVQAYLTYALTAAGDVAATELRSELDQLEARCEKTTDAYELALGALAMHHGKRGDAAKAARQRLLTMQEKSGAVRGSFCGSTTSITCSGKRDLRVETTSLAVLALCSSDKHSGAIRQAIDFLQTQRQQSGAFGATQATVLALQALGAYAKANDRTVQAGEVLVFVDDKEVIRKQVAEGEKNEIRISGLFDKLVPGSNDVRVELSHGNRFPFTFDLAYQSEQPANDVDCKVEIQQWLEQPRVEEGRTVSLQVRVKNRSKEALPMTMAILGLPAGLEVRKEILEDLKKAETIDFWELRGQEVILYWRGMTEGQTREVQLDLLARIPGTTTGAASRTYLYYTAESKHWTAPLQVRVDPASR